MQAIVDGKFSLESASAENLIVLDAEATDAKLLRAALNTAFTVERVQPVEV